MNDILNTNSKNYIFDFYKQNLNNLIPYSTPKIERNRSTNFSPPSYRSNTNTFIKKSIPLNNNIQRNYSNNNTINKINNNNYSNNDNNNFNNNKDSFVNIEDLLLLEEKYVDIINNIKANDISNECFEFLNFYFNSSLYNSFESYFKNPKAKNIVHISIIYVIFNIMFSYNISFDENFFLGEDIITNLL